MSRYPTSSVPEPKTPPWFKDAACFRVGHDLFFGPPSDSDHKETPQEKEEREARARALCESCPVTTDCHDYAASFSNGLQVGIWHGRDDEQRARDRRLELRRAATARRRESQTS